MSAAVTVYVVESKKEYVGLSAAYARSAVRLHRFGLNSTQSASVFASRFRRPHLMRTHQPVTVFGAVTGPAQGLESVWHPKSDQFRKQQHTSAFVGTGGRVDVVQCEQFQHVKSAAGAESTVVFKDLVSQSCVPFLVFDVSASWVIQSPLSSPLRPLFCLGLGQLAVLGVFARDTLRVRVLFTCSFYSFSFVSAFVRRIFTLLPCNHTVIIPRGLPRVV